MCYDDGARPPQPPGEVGKAHGEELVLTAEDGTQFAAYAATAAHPSGARVLIYPDVRGLHQFYKELALRFAEVGYGAVAIDYFGRTAGLTGRDDSFEFMPHVQQLQLQTFKQDVQAALNWMREQAGSEQPVFVVGFCMGGALTLQTGLDRTFNFAGLLPFYAGLGRDFGGQGTVLERAAGMQYPVLAFFGGADQGIPQSDVQQLDHLLDVAKVEHTVVVYPGAPHSFFDRRAEQYAEASADAWKRMLEFIATHTNVEQKT